MGDNIVEIEINKHAIYYQPKTPYSNKYLLSQTKYSEKLFTIYHYVMSTGSAGQEVKTQNENDVNRN